jgi:hypothetical protein
VLVVWLRPAKSGTQRLSVPYTCPSHTSRSPGSVNITLNMYDSAASSTVGAVAASETEAGGVTQPGSEAGTHHRLLSPCLVPPDA